MRIPNCVLDELAKMDNLGHYERMAYLATWAYEPRSITELTHIMKADRTTIARACANLIDLKWMIILPGNHRKRPVSLIPVNCQEVMVKDLKAEYDMLEEKRGEFLTNKRMDWSLRSDEYVLNARPPFLENPQTEQPMEFDRYDPKNRFATEFNGIQHYKQTPGFKKQDVQDQQARDLMKESLSARYGITLLVLTPEDLWPGAIEAKLDKVVPHLKRAYVQMDGPYAKELNRLCKMYAAKAARG